MVKGKQAVNLSLRAKIKDGNTISIEVIDLNNHDCYACLWQFRTDLTPVVTKKSKVSDIEDKSEEV